MPLMLRELTGAYGALLFFSRPAAIALLILSTALQPWTGLCGLVGGLATLGARRLLSVPARLGGLDVLNGILAGLYVGSTFVPGGSALVLVVLAGPLTILVGGGLQGVLVQRSGLPLLSAPFCVVALVLFAAGRALALPYAPLPAAGPLDGTLAGLLPAAGQGFLYALGAIYFSPTLTGGLLVLAAMALSSRSLVLTAVLAFAAVAALFTLLGIPSWSVAWYPANTAAILTALMVGGLFARPGLRSLAMAGGGGAAAALLSLVLGNILWFLALPPLSLPFLIATWLLMIALRAEHGAPWAHYWLTFPEFPEDGLERGRQQTVRGLIPGSVALRAPFFGGWTVYQGFDGAHTHRDPWRHALDFHRLVEGRAHRGDGMALADYHCFGAPVCAPAYGSVVAARGDLPDNPPGEVDAANCWGNYVLIGLATGDHVLLAHLQQGSVTVWAGTAVVPGQPVARCGNSGRSPQPHLHLHVQTGPWLGNPTRPFHLACVRLDHGGQTTFALDGVPVEGDGVAVPALNGALAKGLHWTVGRRFTFETEGGAGRSGGGAGRAAERTLEVDLDLAGRTWLRSDGGARIAVAESDCLVALYDREGPADPFLDGFALAAGLTPFIDDPASWRDAPPLRLLPAPLWLRALGWLLPGLVVVDSRHHRDWCAETLSWRQHGSHRVRLLGAVIWSCRSLAHLSESHGVTGFSVDIGGRHGDGRQGLRARMTSHGLRGDRGIAGWERPVGMEV